MRVSDAAGRIADRRGKVADEKNHRMAMALEIAQLLERQRMAQMQVGRRRVHSQLDSQRAAFAQFRGQLGRRDHFDGIMREFGGMFRGFGSQ